MKKSEILNKIILALSEAKDFHKPKNNIYEFFSVALQKEIKKLFSNENAEAVEFLPFGEIIFPYHKLGEAVDSLNLFEVDEMMVFSFYWANKNRYKKVLDLGANIGLHSVLMAKCGYTVDSYEPDPFHFKILKENITINGLNSVNAFNQAVSVTNTNLNFTRVKGNTMSSHISGAKPSPYGDLEYFTVEARSFKDIIKGTDFVKMDVEAHEKELVKLTDRADWENMDAMVSIHNQENADAVFSHLTKIGVNIFSQFINWKKAGKIEDIPINHFGGSILVSTKDEMPW
ncbi:MAG: hypothetical protein A2020_07415 [Lentisphaerae bacterium GWF2_45_14]|nr:MAG: hypothetical protein A2020_07415 [Lentisphaerae bacterium GWF2_45_14]